MKTPLGPRKLPPFPHEYAYEAERLLARANYLLRDYMLTMVGVAENMPQRQHVTTPRAVLLLGIEGGCRRIMEQARAALDSEIDTNNLLNDLGIPRQQ